MSIPEGNHVPSTTLVQEAKPPKARVRTAITVAVVLIVSGASFGLTLIKPTISPAWFGSSRGCLELFELKRDGSQLSGTVEFAGLDDTDCGGTGTGSGTQVVTNTFSVSGAISGDKVTLDADGVTLTGTISGARMALGSSEGGMVDLADHAAPSHFSAALKELRAQAKAAAVRQSVQAVVDQAATVVSSDLQAVQSDTDFSSATGTVADDLTTLQGDLTTLQGDLSTVQSDVSNQWTGTCSDAQSMASDFSSMVNDSKSLASDADKVESAAQTLNTDLQTLETDQAKLASDQRKIPSYQSPNAPDPGTFQATVSAAQQAMTGAVSQVNGDIKQANNTTSQGYTLLTNAFSTGGCTGPAVGAPTSISLIAAPSGQSGGTTS